MDSEFELIWDRVVCHIDIVQINNKHTQIYIKYPHTYIIHTVNRDVTDKMICFFDKQTFPSQIEEFNVPQ